MKRRTVRMRLLKDAQGTHYFDDERYMAVVERPDGSIVNVPWQTEEEFVLTLMRLGDYKEIIRCFKWRNKGASL